MWPEDKQWFNMTDWPAGSLNIDSGEICCRAYLNNIGTRLYVKFVYTAGRIFNVGEFRIEALVGR